MSVSLDNVAVKISDLIDDYASGVQLEALDRLDETAEKILQYIFSNCPRSGLGSNHLADSFISTEVGSGLNKIIYISSKTKGRLVHLIELGFKLRRCKHVAAQPFMRPANESFTPKLLEDIRNII